MAAIWRLDRNLFWRNYKPHGKGCPFTAEAMARFIKSKMNSYASPAPGDATVAPEPAPVPASAPTRAHTETHVDVTQACRLLRHRTTAAVSTTSLAVQMCATAAALADAPAMPHSLLARPAATQWRVVAARLSILIDVGACWTACQTHGRALSYATLVHHHRLHHRHRRHHLPGPRHHHRLHHHPLHPLHPRLQLWWSPMKMALSAG
jgi:hypothetical protein